MIILEVIGYTKENSGINFEIPSNMNFYGFLPLNKAREIIKTCHVGVSSLAMDRVKLHEACVLKTRQYLSQGLPIILGYKDTDLMHHHNLPFILELQEGENNVRDNLAKIRDFIERVKDYNKDEIISFAKNSIDFAVKEENRLNFIKQFVV